MKRFAIIGGIPRRRSTKRSLTDTDTSVQTHRHPSHALAAERPLRVDAATVHAHSRGLTFVDVWGRDRVTSFLRDYTPPNEGCDARIYDSKPISCRSSTY